MVLEQLLVYAQLNRFVVLAVDLVLVRRRVLAHLLRVTLEPCLKRIHTLLLACGDYPANQRDRCKQVFLIQEGQAVILLAFGLDASADMFTPEVVGHDKANGDKV